MTPKLRHTDDSVRKRVRHMKEFEGIEDEDGKAYQPGQSKPGSAATKRNGKVRHRSGAAGVKSPDFFL